MDSAHKKVTYPGLNGLEDSRKRLATLTENAVNSLASYYDNAELFTKLAVELADRRC